MSGLIRKILIADDVYTNRAILKTIFKDYYDVLEAENGIETINLIRENPDIALVMLDLMMPGMSGLEVLERLKEEGVLHRLPFIAMTADTELEDQIKALDLGVQDVILKPYNSKVVWHRVNNILERRDNERFEEESRQYVEEIRRKEELFKKSLYDAKTGLYTKNSFCNAVKDIIKENPEHIYALVRWDIDRFRVYNDVYGVKVADELLVSVGELLRTEDSLGVIQGYLGVDHFISCVELHKFDIDRYMRKVENHLQKTNPDYEFVVRYGVYVIDEPETDVSLMCDRALFALRSCKEGKNPERYAFYDSGMRALAVEEQEIVNEINNAIQSGQIMVYYQPQMDFVRGVATGAEALVRWNHPQKGLFSPARFIPVLEKNGLISKLDFFVWEEVCKQQRAWLDAGKKPVPVSVNLSRVDVYRKNLIGYLDSLVGLYHLEKDYIHLAVTEDAYKESPEQLESLVKEFQKNGYFVEMDDFGGGGETLNAIKDIPVDLIRLELSFVRECTAEERGQVILRSVIDLANTLSTPVVAEGVERLEQAELLHNIGCDYMQGFLFAKPLPADEFESFLTEYIPPAKEENAAVSPELKPLSEQMEEESAKYMARYEEITPAEEESDTED